MMPGRRNRNPGLRICGCWPVLVGLVFLNASWAETVTLHLRNGDRVTGDMMSQDTGSVTITNRLLGKIVVPLAEVERMVKQGTEPAAAKPTNAPSPPAPSTNAPPPAAAAPTAATNQPTAQAAPPAPAPKPAP